MTLTAKLPAPVSKQGILEQHEADEGDLVTEIRKMKKEPGADLVIMGSGSIVPQLAQQSLIDEYQW